MPAERRYHHFQFNWGKRLCPGPTFSHAEGFTSFLAALESFRLALTQACAAKEPEELTLLRSLVRRKVLLPSVLQDVLMRGQLKQPPTAEEVYEFFSQLWTMTTDDLEGDTPFTEALEAAGWSIPEGTPEGLVTFNGVEDWMIEAPAYLGYDWREEDPIDLPFIRASGNFFDWYSHHHRTWEHV